MFKFQKIKRISEIRNKFLLKKLKFLPSKRSRNPTKRNLRDKHQESKERRSRRPLPFRLSKPLMANSSAYIAIESSRNMLASGAILLRLIQVCLRFTKRRCKLEMADQMPENF